MQRSVKTGAFILALAVAVVMATVSFFTEVSNRLDGEQGICFSSPNQWAILPGLSWGLNTLLIICTTLMIINLNHRYYFIPRSDLLLPALIPVMICAFPWLSKEICSSSILLIIIILCIMILFDSYGRRNTTQQTFLIASMLALGSTIQYAFIFYMPLFIMAGIALKTFPLKNLPAFIIGTIAPYWCLLGLGIISFNDFRIPVMSNIFVDFAPKSEILFLVIACGIIALAWLFLMSNNSIRLLKANSNVRRFNMAINIIGGGTILFMIADFTNFLAYIGTLIFCTAVQITLSASDRHDSSGAGILFSVAVVFAAFFSFIVITY